jgi:4-hydroxybenzoate polyprenyltransferase
MSLPGTTAASRGARVVAQAIFDLSRTRQALLSVAQPALGAALALGRLPSLGRIGLGLVAATTGFLAVFSLNDVLDRKVDEQALEAGRADFEGYDLDTMFLRHPLARGDITLAVALAWILSLATVSAVAAYLLSPMCLVLFVMAVVHEIVYCGLSSVTWAKTFVSGLMVGLGGLAGWAAVAPLSSAAVGLFAFLALWEIAGRNLPNDLADLEADNRTPVRTVATTFGPRISARATLVGAVATIGSIALLPMPRLAVLPAMGIALLLMGEPAVALVRNPTSKQAGSYFNRASLLPALILPVVILVLVGAQ